MFGGNYSTRVRDVTTARVCLYVCVYMCVCESWAHCSSLVIFFIFHYSTKGSKFRLWRGSFKRGSIGAESHYLNHQKSKKR